VNDAVSGFFGLILILVLFAGLTALYFVPAYVAYKRKKQNFTSILLVNFFFGWSMIGWVGCLAWALAADNAAVAAAPVVTVVTTSPGTTTTTTPGAPTKPPTDLPRNY
jgi:cell division protein FtsX